MNKSKQKKYPHYDQDVLNVLHKRHGYSKMYIRKFLSGERKSIMGDRIVKEYQKLVKASKEAQKEKEKTLQNIVND